MNRAVTGNFEKKIYLHVLFFHNRKEERVNHLCHRSKVLNMSHPNYALQQPVFWLCLHWQEKKKHWFYWKHILKHTTSNFCPMLLSHPCNSNKWENKSSTWVWIWAVQLLVCVCDTKKEMDVLFWAAAKRQDYEETLCDAALNIQIRSNALIV